MSDMPRFNENESPLFRLYVRRDKCGQSAVSEFQFAAGERLRADYERANFERRITSSWEGVRSGAMNFSSISDNRIANLADAAIDARARVHAAFDAVGPELSGVLYYVCCLAGGLEQAERMMNLPQRSGKAVLSLGLTRLARHYKLVKGKPRSQESTTLAHWALSDYRPQIMPAEQNGRQT